MKRRLEQGQIYLITNTINNKKYVGQTWYDLSVRWSDHCRKKKKGGCPYLYRAITKHGRSAFTMESIARFDDANMADSLEIHYINLYQSNDPQYGYNLTGGGQDSRPSMPLAIRQKISEARKGMKFSQETKNRMSEAHKNIILSEDSQQALNASRARKRKLTMVQANQIRQKEKMVYYYESW